ncbi:type II toxin-antitoxin system VapC family toxin [Methanooceanicella nereidis]|uniref:type II toxin-antitoxin system VapC family toxin n=1 Tax=Methanooceanicella nereidis TaxID=2052831 RepID=UPI001E606878
MIIDTNGLMVPAQWGVDIFNELEALGYDEFVTPSAVVEEIEKLKGKVKGRDRTALAIAREMLKKCEIIEAQGFADDVVIEVAKSLNAPVFTNDAGLRARLKKEGIRSIYLRAKHKLAIE